MFRSAQHDTAVHFPIQAALIQEIATLPPQSAKMPVLLVQTLLLTATR